MSNGTCRECTLYKPLNRFGHCAICASQTPQGPRDAPLAVYDHVVSYGSTIDFSPVDESFRMHVTVSPVAMGGRKIRVIVTYED